MNTALDSCTRPVRVPGSTWPNRCSGSLSGELWRDTTSMMWRSSKTGLRRRSRDGIVIPPPSFGEGNATPAATGLMRVVIGKADEALPPGMCCRDAFVRYAIIDRSAMPSQKASDPLGVIKEEAIIDLKPLTVLIGPNNAGKTWLAYSLAGILGSFGSTEYAQAYSDKKVPNTYEILDNAIKR